jgi:hypothetical protein
LRPRVRERVFIFTPLLVALDRSRDGNQNILVTKRLGLLSLAGEFISLIALSFIAVGYLNYFLVPPITLRLEASTSGCSLLRQVRRCYVAAIAASVDLTTKSI